MNNLIKKAEASIAGAVEAIQQPRTMQVLRAFVVNQHDTPGQQWAQCVLEAQIKMTCLAEAGISREELQHKIKKLKRKKGGKSDRKLRRHRIALKQLEWAALGASRELECLLTIKEELEASHVGRGWTREELDAEQPEYWRLRLTRQAMQDVNATGRVGVGNQDALRMAGMSVPGSDSYIQHVERRLLESANQKLLIVVPTLIPREDVSKNGLRCLQGWSLPGTFQRRVFCVTGRPVADAYTEAVHEAKQHGADFILCVEDDHVIPEGTFERIWSVYRQHGPRCVVGAWYPQKRKPQTGASVVLRDGMREPLNLDGQHNDIQEVFIITQGFTLIPMSVFYEIPHPWFATTGSVTQDAFFSQLAREAGYKLIVDTDAKIKHVDRETGEVFE